LIQPTCLQNLTILALAIPDICLGLPKFKPCHVTWPCELPGRFVTRMLGHGMFNPHTKFEVSEYPPLRYKDNVKCRNWGGLECLEVTQDH